MEGKYLTLLLVAVIVLTLLLTATLTVLVWFLFKVHRNKETDQTAASPKKRQKSLASESRCPNHADKPTAGKCALCEKSFCDECLFSPDGPSFCREHIGVYLGTTWAELGEVKTTPMTPRAAEHLYRTKRELLESGKIPSFILTNYKINTEADTIESYVCLCVPRDKEKEILQKMPPSVSS